MRSRGWIKPKRLPQCRYIQGHARPKASPIRSTAWTPTSYSRLITKSGPLVLIPYPAVTVDMGHYLERLKEPSDMERLWIDYVTELCRRGRGPSRP